LFDCTPDFDTFNVSSTKYNVTYLFSECKSVQQTLRSERQRVSLIRAKPELFPSIAFASAQKQQHPVSCFIILVFHVDKTSESLYLKLVLNLTKDFFKNSELHTPLRDHLALRQRSCCVGKKGTYKLHTL
jgi:hypothetical protein